MKPLWTRKPTAILALACAVVQLAFGSSLVVSALALGSHASAHAHSVALHADGNHVDLVLSHAAVEHEHAPGTPAHVHPPVWTHGDHVVHIKGAERANATARRAVLQSAPVLVIATVLPPSAPPSWIAHPAPEPRAHGVDQLRTVVLRL